MALFLTSSLKITSGEISAKEAAEERIWAGRTPRRKPRVPDAPKSEHDITWKSIRIKSAEMQKIQKHKIAKNLENNAETWYNFGTNKPVLVRQRYAVVL